MKNHRGTKKRFMAVALSLAMIATAVAGTGNPAAAVKAVKVKKLTLKKPVIRTLALKRVRATV